MRRPRLKPPHVAPPDDADSRRLRAVQALAERPGTAAVIREGEKVVGYTMMRFRQMIADYGEIGACALAAGGMGIRKIATKFGIGTGSVQRIKDYRSA